METLTALFNNPKWGDLQDYDVIVNRVGEGLETKYSTTPDPKEELTAEEKEKSSVKKKEESTEGKVEESEVNVDEVPF